MIYLEGATTFADTASYCNVPNELAGIVAITILRFTINVKTGSADTLDADAGCVGMSHDPITTVIVGAKNSYAIVSVSSAINPKGFCESGGGVQAKNA